MFNFNNNILIRPLRNNFLHLYNVENRSNVYFSDYALTLLNKIISTNNKKKIDDLFKKKLKFCDKTDFTLWKNLYENSNFLSIKKNDKFKFETISLKLFIQKLIEKKIIFKNKKIKKNFFLKRYEGNLNKQLLTESYFRKQKLHSWWEKQKFKSNRELQNTPYKYIQSEFLKKYFLKNLKKKRVMEVGCGNGYYCFQMSKYAKKVIGVDYENDYIKNAQKKQNNKIQFINCDLSKVKNFSRKIGNQKFDFIFMIDFFLFLFQMDFQKDLFINKFKIFNQLKKSLKDNGKVIVIDPHLFWLTPFFGSEEKPFGILTDYNSKSFSTTPTLQTTANFFSKCGFSISNIYEPTVGQKYKKINKINFEYFKNFPQWIVYEIIKK